MRGACRTTAPAADCYPGGRSLHGKGEGASASECEVSDRGRRGARQCAARPFARAQASLLEADFVLSADGATVACGRAFGLHREPRARIARSFPSPAPVGICTSGRHGGAVPNAIHAVSQLVAGLHDECERVAVGGFYEDVRLPEEATREAVRRPAVRRSALPSLDRRCAKRRRARLFVTGTSNGFVRRSS